jgi:peptide deformylase
MVMRIQDVVTVPDQILRKKAEKVVVFDVELANFARKMVEMMRRYDGVGLAAPQVGVSKRIIVILKLISGTNLFHCKY